MLKSQRQKLKVLSKQTADKVFSLLLELNQTNDEPMDLCCLYKAPMMLVSNNETEKANRILDEIRKNNMQGDGDFLTNSSKKSVKPEYEHFWCYINGWIIRAAYALGRRDIINQSLPFVLRYYDNEFGVFVTNRNHYCDVLTNAHLGLVCLEQHHMKQALNAGYYLTKMIDNQPELSKGFYLTSTKNCDVLTESEVATSPFAKVSPQEPFQLYFMIGYPIAYLSMLYQYTCHVDFLEAAKKYANFAITCSPHIEHSDFSHKVAWSLACLYPYSQNDQYLELCHDIIEHFIANRSANGLWHEKDYYTALDQSAEISYWFNEIDKILSSQQRRPIAW